MGKELDIGEFELLEICRSKGIHIWTCSAMRDLVNMILSKPIATAAAADTDAVGTCLSQELKSPRLKIETLSLAM